MEIKVTGEETDQREVNCMYSRSYSGDVEYKISEFPTYHAKCANYLHAYEMKKSKRTPNLPVPPDTSTNNQQEDYKLEFRERNEQLERISLT